MRVLKFGGTSVGSPEAVARIIEILRDGELRERTFAVVVSALSGITDSLIRLAREAETGGENSGFTPGLEVLRTRHLDLAAAFLRDQSLGEAEAGIDHTLSELRRVLDGVSLLGELSARTLDYIMSFGERFSAPLLALIFDNSGIPSVYLDPRKLVRTDDTYGNARFRRDETYSLIRGYFAESAKTGKLPVAAGFIGSTGEGITTTLGRGGSDLSAAIFAAALDVEEVEIWTDVDGILTADPRLVQEAFRIDSISYEEASELSHFGAKVLFPPTIRPALEKGIPIRIKNTFNPQCPGTRISRDAEVSAFPIRGMSSINDVALIRVQGTGMVGVAGFSSRLFGALAGRRINIILITQSSSEHSICLAVLPSDAASAEASINEEFQREIASGLIDPPFIEKGLSIIAVVGAGMKRLAGISGKVFHALGRNGINVVAIAQGSSELNISAVISRQDEAKALNAVHEAFFLSGVRSVNLFLVGIGLIGGTLVEQIASHREVLEDQYRIRINIAGAANSKNMVFRSEGLDSGKVKALLRGEIDQEGIEREAFTISAFIGRMKAFNLPNTAFCDCTASDAVSARYGEILQASIPIVTPNKRANSGSFEYYKTITGYSRDRGIPYLYETTVCAGLPVISTLRDLALSGDRVRRIEAVLSGTLSFIFNNFDGSKTFSALVREAKAKGYTEPDPREDLNAMDAARKALILARECGLSLEFSSVTIEPILPPACFQAATVGAFFTELEKSDRAFENRRAAAVASGKALRYAAVIEEGSARISLREESEGSPFRSLMDSDNIVVITTDRYSSLPMVIKGPGAGAQVTAGGVFADIVRIARTLV
jgi:aspartokinase/homoserine dehydrogenase 1